VCLCYQTLIHSSFFACLTLPFSYHFFIPYFIFFSFHYLSFQEECVSLKAQHTDATAAATAAAASSAAALSDLRSKFAAAELLLVDSDVRVSEALEKAKTQAGGDVRAWELKALSLQVGIPLSYFDCILFIVSFCLLYMHTSERGF
jgi:hypothetical protein